MADVDAIARKLTVVKVARKLTFVKVATGMKENTFEKMATEKIYF